MDPRSPRDAAPAPRPDRLLVVDDEPAVANALCRQLAAAGYEVLAPVTVARRVEGAVVIDRPDLVLLDISLDGDNDGVALGAELVHRHGVPVLFVSGRSDPVTLARLEVVGPHGFVVKPYSSEQLRASVRVALGRAADAPGPGRRERVRGTERLTPGEHELLEALLEGRRARGIAASRGVSLHTVRNQVKAILGKLGVHSQAQLLERFLARGSARSGDG